MNANFGIAGPGPDLFFVNYLVGIVEPFAPTANADGGTTQCTVEWNNRNPPYQLTRVDELMTNDPIGGTGPLFTVGLGVRVRSEGEG